MNFPFISTFWTQLNILLIAMVLTIDVNHLNNDFIVGQTLNRVIKWDKTDKFLRLSELINMKEALN